jgi:hypothetical protein
LTSSLRITPGNIVKGILFALLPWLPVYLFEKLDFYYHLTRQVDLYFSLSGNRLLVDLAAFALAGILAAYRLRPRWALLQVLLSSILVWVLFYVACPTLNGQSECYYPGPDQFVGFRFVGIMFCYGALPILVRLASKGDTLDRRLRPWIALFGGVVLTVVVIWYPLAAWFSGVTYLEPLVIFQEILLFGIPQIATGVLAARTSRSLKMGAVSGVVSLLLVSAALWTSDCPGCDRSLLYPLVPSWAFFALLGAVTELGLPTSLHLPTKLGWLLRIRKEDVQRIALAFVMMICLWTLIAHNYWDPNILYAPSVSPSLGNLTLGQPTYPYVGGYYNSLQYRICCVEIGVNISMAHPQSLAPDNFLMAGMGVQSPNCCVDGWDFGWRADLFLMPNGDHVISGSSWETCDSNANCGGYIWEHLWYHSQVNLGSQISSTVNLRMSWEPTTVGAQQRMIVNWYYNVSGNPWTKFGSYLPDARLGTYFDIGLSGGPASTIPEGSAFLYQFGVASKEPVAGWNAFLIQPSFLYRGTWKTMEHANIVQGDFSYWKVNYRWGGAAYPGMTARANLTGSTVLPEIVEFSYTGGTLRNFAPLW